MATETGTRQRPIARSGGRTRRTTETKDAFKTTEFFSYLAVLVAVLIAGAIVDDGDFGAREVWFYATILTIGYMISRGLAKAGSREPYWDDATARDRADDRERIRR